MRPAPTALTRRGLLAALAAALLSAGCGFQLRGSAEMPFSTLYAGFPPGSETGLEFARMMRGNSTRLVDRPQDAQARLEVLGEGREKEIVGFSSTGRPREHQLRLLFSFRLMGAGEEELIPPTQLVLRRDITTTDTQYVAKEQEEALLYRDMQRDLVQQLLRRLSAARR
ncbi:MAG: LPS assembly lipoprotein LptE [Gammaproteobacteria bacterium]